MRLAATHLRCARGLGLCIAVACIAGCQTARVEPLPGRYVIGLSANDTVKLMRQAGLPDEEILKNGLEVRNDLATYGSARIRKGEELLALFIVRGDEIIVSSRNGSRFVYRPEKKEP